MDELEFFDIVIDDSKSSRIINKWRDLGFLGNLVNERNVSLAYELISIWMLSHGKKYNDYSTPIYPVIYRILSKYTEDIPVDILKAFVLELLEDFPIGLYLGTSEHSINHADIMKEYGLDTEAITVAAYADSYPELKM